MARKKPKRPQSSKVSKRKWKKINLRIDPHLVPIIDECAEAERRTRNVMLIVLIEEALKARGRVV